MYLNGVKEWGQDRLAVTICRNDVTWSWLGLSGQQWRVLTQTPNPRGGNKYINKAFKEQHAAHWPHVDKP
jgi:hypothetical protein